MIIINDISFITNENTLLNIATPGLLTGISDNMRTVALTQPSNGILTLKSDGSFKYQPNFNFQGADQFTVMVTNGIRSDTAVVSLFTCNPPGWTWRSGSGNSNVKGNYGTMNVPLAQGAMGPGSREDGVMWWVNGHLYLFGGLGVSSTGVTDQLNDFWKYDIRNDVWTWIGGSTTDSSTGSYGTKGVAASTNIPRAREDHAAWRDSNCNLWLFGGLFDGTNDAPKGFGNDLWKYDTVKGLWTWVSGSNQSGQTANYGTRKVPSAGNIIGARGNTAWGIDSQDKLWIFGGSILGLEALDSHPFTNYNDLWYYDINSDVWVWVSGSQSTNQIGKYTGSDAAPGARQDSIMFVDSLDRIWIFGGSGLGSTNKMGRLNDLWMYDPKVDKWTFMGGSTTANDQAGVYGTQGVAASTNWPGAREDSAPFVDGFDNLWLFGGQGYDRNGAGGFLNDVWRYDPSTGLWTWVGGLNTNGANISSGTRCVPAVTNSPGAREDTLSCVGDDGTFYIFGGQSTNNDRYQDLWEYRFTTPPKAYNDFYSTYRNQSLTISGANGILTNDNSGAFPVACGVINNAKFVYQYTQPTNGSVTVNPDGSFVYTPKTNYTGSDAFTYTIINSRCLSDRATVYINVLPNISAVNDTALTQINTPVIINVLNNDTDPNGRPLVISSVTTPSRGTAVISDNRVRYTPNAGYCGSDQFNYTISNGFGGTATATVFVTVNCPPRAFSDSVLTQLNTPITINVLTNDSDADGNPLTVTTVSTPSRGTAIISDNRVRYTPNTGYCGPDQFTYTITDGQGGTDTAIVFVRINCPPRAFSDSVLTQLNTPITINVLTNDSDADGNPLTVTTVSTPSRGTAIISDNRVRYTPNTGYCGPDQFTYTITDGMGGTDTATVFVRVNCPPRAFSDNVLTQLNTPITINVLTNDSDADGNPLTVTTVSTPSRGTAIISDNRVRYTPNTGYCGPDQFTYTITDGQGGTDTTTVFVTVNCPPRAFSDSVLTQLNTPITINVLANDSDADGNPLTVTTVSTPSRGTAIISDNRVRYTPNTGYCGPDQFTYTITDGMGGTDTATVFLIVNCPPRAFSDNVLTQLNTPVTINVLANDSDADGNPLTVTTVSTPSRGTAIISDNRVRYTPNTGYCGPDQFTYTITDGQGGTDTTTVFVTVNCPPRAFSDSVLTQLNTPITINVLTNDSDADGNPLTVTTVSTPSRGTAIISDNRVRYTPNTGYCGPDQFTYTITDGMGGTDTATVFVRVNCPPRAFSDNVLTQLNTPITINVLTNDSDADGNPLTVTTVSTPSRGTAIISDNRVRYTPNTGYCGPDQFTYTITDGQGGTDTATVFVTVNCPPRAFSDSVLTQLNTPITINVLANDSDVDGNPLTVTNVSTPSRGTAIISDNRVRYTPNTGYCGPDQFTYTVTDGQGGTDTSTVFVRINCPPRAFSDNVLTQLNTPVTINVLANDSDADGNPLTVTSVGTPSRGTAIISDNRVRYTPNTGYCGPDQFTYTITDGQGGTDTATVFVRINCPPDAIDDAYTATKNTTLSIGAPGVLGNDSDVDGNTITVCGYTQPTNGTVAVGVDGSFTYVPQTNFTGIDTFTYTICDGYGGQDTATATIRVQEPAPHVSDCQVATCLNQCDQLKPSLRVVFQDLYAGTRPCVRLDDPDLIGAIQLSMDHCFSIDGCNSSLVFTSINQMKNAVKNPQQPWEKVVARYFTCSDKNKTCS